MIVYGSGPLPARVLGLGEAPGETEDRTGIPFSGRTGDSMERYWGRGGVPLRDDIFLTNVIKQWPGKGNRDPLDAEIDYWLPSLCGEIAACQPAVILTLGRFALRLFVDLDMEAAHGIPLAVPLSRIERPLLRDALRAAGVGGDDGDACVHIFPCYHPAFALHDPTMQSLLTYDFERFGQFMRGLLPPRPLDTDTRGHYEAITHTPPTLYSPRLGIDTEGYTHAVWGLSYSDHPGSGKVVRAKDAPKFKKFLERELYRATIEADQAGAADPDLVVYLHHALHDLPILRELDIDLLTMGFDVRDTMVMAYLLGLEPQGLKPLGWRHCGMQMQDYTDLTAVSDERVAREWLIRLCASLPEPQPPKSKRKKSDPPLIEYDPITADCAKARKLIEAMMRKATPIRKRWNQKKCAARVILEDELGVVDEMPLPTLDDVIEDHGGDETPVIEYAGADPDATRRLGPILEAQIDAYGLRDAFETTNGIIPMVDRMQQVGIKANPEHFHALIPIFDGRAAELDTAIWQMTGAAINANSGDQVAHLLFDKLKLHKKPETRHIKLKRTDTGRYSTDDKALEALEGVHPVVELIRQRREMTKLKTSYVLPILRLYDKADFRLRGELLLTRTDTGRLAARKPNLLAWPKHSEWGMLIRHGFVADEGHEFGAWDMDQIEMRVFADNANEINMLLAFAAGQDMHASTGARIFGRKYEDVYGEYLETKRLKRPVGQGDEQRFAAKAVNFGILMGITEFGLLAQFHKNGQLHWTLDQCADLLREWKKMYPSGAAWITSKHEEARRFSYVRDMFGRLRWLDGVHSDDDYIRAEAERMAQSTPIQSGAQGIMQRAMKNAWPDLVRLRRTTWTEPLLQTHDELLFEYDSRARSDMDRLVLGHMARAVTLKVPVTAKGAYGQTWGEVA